MDYPIRRRNQPSTVYGPPLVKSVMARYWFIDEAVLVRARELPGDFNDVAWDRDDALRVIDSACNNAVAIVGGDVWEVHGPGSNLSITYDNWSSDQRDGEDGTAYAQRSCDEARRFVEAFDSTREYAFVIVPGASTS